MKNKTTKTIACVIAGLTLTACGSGSGITGIDSNENAMPSITDRVASQSQVGTFSKGSNLEDSADNTITRTNRKTDDTFSLRVEGGECLFFGGFCTRQPVSLIMRVNGVEYTFTPVVTVSENDRDRIEWVNTDNATLQAKDLVDDYDSLSDIIAGDHSTIDGTFIRYSVDTNDYDSNEANFNVDHTDGYTTVGIQTSAEVVANQVAVATYDGEISIRINQGSRAGSVFDAITRQKSLFGTISMDVDFDANTISGTATLTRFDNSISVPAGTANFESTAIIGNKFDGNFTLDSDARTGAGLTGNPTGYYGGNFFGPNADDLAGVMELNGTNANGDVFGYGGFRGDRN